MEWESTDSKAMVHSSRGILGISFLPALEMETWNQGMISWSCISDLFRKIKEQRSKYEPQSWFGILQLTDRTHS